MAKKEKSKAELEKKIKALEKENKNLKLDRNLLNSLLKHIPENIYFKDRESKFVRIGRAFGEYMGFKNPDDIIGKTDFDLFDEEHARPAYEDEQKIMETGEPLQKEEKEVYPDGSEKWVETTKVPRYNEKGKIVGTFGISRDVTAKKLWEMEREKKIEAQREELIELSTPVIDVWEGVLTVPILGSLDSERASRVSEALLTEIVEKRAAVAIIDISGISAVDSAVADRLIRTAKAVRLVGAEAILTGVGVEIAQTIADLGIDMEGLRTMSTLKDGLRYVISRKNLLKEIVSKKD
jgi:rsbT co-antagonist protein RsbR